MNHVLRFNMTFGRLSSFIRRLLGKPRYQFKAILPNLQCRYVEANIPPAPRKISFQYSPREDRKSRPTLEMNLEKCEKPEPMKLFHAVDAETAQKAAEQKGYLILWHERDRYDLWARKQCYWCLTTDFGFRLLCCEKDLRRNDEFTVEEQVILKDLAVRGWIRKMKTDGILYYYGLSPKTAKILRNQLKRRIQAKVDGRKQIRKVRVERN